MSQVKCLKVEITQNSLLKTVAEVPQWEAQVLLAVWGEDAIVKDEVIVDRKVPEANDEFVRLANKYGPKDSDNPFVARVYGNFGPGIRSLANEIHVSQPDLPPLVQAAPPAIVQAPPAIAPVVTPGVQGLLNPVAVSPVELTQVELPNADSAEGNKGVDSLLPPNVTLESLVDKAGERNDIASLVE